MLKSILLSLLIFICLKSYGQTKHHIKDTIKVDHYQTDRFDCAIFPFDFKCFLLPKKKRFTPTRQDIDKAEVLLNDSLPKIDSPSINYNNPIIYKNLNKYRRQYFGFIDKQGHKIVLINCFWDLEDEFRYWLKDIIDVDDGGSYFWNIKVDLDKGQLFELRINGEA